MPDERWKPIPGFLNYSVSTQGRIRRTNIISLPKNGYRPPQIFRPSLNKQGYVWIQLWAHGKFISRAVHHLVLEAFSRPRKPGEETNHKDGNQWNNCLENLEWVTPLQNVTHAYANGFVPKIVGERNGNSRLTEQDVRLIRALYRPYKMSMRKLAKRFKVSDVTICVILKRRGWKHL